MVGAGRDRDDRATGGGEIVGRPGNGSGADAIGVRDAGGRAAGVVPTWLPATGTGLARTTRTPLLRARTRLPATTLTRTTLRMPAPGRRQRTARALARTAALARSRQRVCPARTVRCCSTALQRADRFEPCRTILACPITSAPLATADSETLGLAERASTSPASTSSRASTQQIEQPARRPGARVVAARRRGSPIAIHRRTRRAFGASAVLALPASEGLAGEQPPQAIGVGQQEAAAISGRRGLPVERDAEHDAAIRPTPCSVVGGGAGRVREAHAANIARKSASTSPT